VHHRIGRSPVDSPRAQRSATNMLIQHGECTFLGHDAYLEFSPAIAIARTTLVAATDLVAKIGTTAPCIALPREQLVPRS
jgi:hypothetical protein